MGHEEIVKILLDAGAAVNYSDMVGVNRSFGRFEVFCEVQKIDKSYRLNWK